MQNEMFAKALRILCSAKIQVRKYTRMDHYRVSQIREYLVWEARLDYLAREISCQAAIKSRPATLADNETSYPG